MLQWVCSVYPEELIEDELEEYLATHHKVSPLSSLSTNSQIAQQLRLQNMLLLGLSHYNPPPAEFNGHSMYTPDSNYSNYTIIDLS